MKTIFLTAAWLLTMGSMASALPISGRPVPTMAAFDGVMTDFMEEWSVEAGLMGMMLNNRIVYLRGFGSMDPDLGANMPENAMIRQASATKPATAAAIRLLAADGSFGAEGLARKAFRITVNNVSNNGLLNLTAFPSLGDARYADITLEQLILHRGGFFPRNSDGNDGPGDPVLLSREIAGDMGVDSPPSRSNVIRWTLGWPLRDDPGLEFEYSNFGYLVLGEIIQQVSGQSYVNFLHDRVFTPDMWVPRSELEGARTLREDRNIREPWYRGGGNAVSVFDNEAPFDIVPREYGGYHLPMMMAHGGLIASVPTMLALGNAYHLDVPTIGQPNPTGTMAHGGALYGLLTVIDQRSDGVVLYLALNRRYEDGVEIPIATLKESVSDLLDAGPGNGWSWPDASSDGVWVRMTNRALPDGLGGYDDPWTGFANSVSRAQNNTRLRLKAGDSSFTGTINKRLRLDAPLGLVRIGVPN